MKEIENSIKELPLPEKIKAIAIYKRYKEIRKIEEQMKDTRKDLEKKFLLLDAPVLKNISDLVRGGKNIEKEELNDLEKYLTEEERGKVDEHLKARRIEGYWFKVLGNASIVKDTFGKYDDELLKCIENIHVVDEEGTDNFTIVFQMTENEIIKNKDIWKKFYIKNDEPFKCEASQIEWKGRNLTMKEVKKKQKNKKTGQQRVITKTVEAKSFFGFFTSIEEITGKDIENNEEELNKKQKLQTDFEVGGIIVDEVLPYSLEYYLGIEHEGDEDDGDDDDEDLDDDDEDDKNRKKSKSKGKHKDEGKKKDDGKEGKDGKAQEKP